MDNVATKKCTRCNLEKSLSCFYKRPTYKDGLAYNCKDCLYERTKQWQAANPERHKELNRKSLRAKYAKNPEYFKKQSKKYFESNPEKALKGHREACKKHRLNNLSYFANREANHRASKLQAMPKWLTAEQLQQIKSIYDSCPTGYHVDHIIPLQGENVSGLHVSWNLQHLPALENIKKGNKLEVPLG